MPFLATPRHRKVRNLVKMGQTSSNVQHPGNTACLCLCWGCKIVTTNSIYPLVMCYIAMENHHAING